MNGNKVQLGKIIVSARKFMKFLLFIHEFSNNETEKKWVKSGSNWQSNTENGCHGNLSLFKSVICNSFNVNLFLGNYPYNDW